LSEFSAGAGIGRVGALHPLPLFIAVAQSARHDTHHDGLFWDAVHRLAAFDSAPLLCGRRRSFRTFWIMDFEDTQLMPKQR